MGMLTNFSRQLHSYSPITGMTQTKRIEMTLNVDAVIDNKAYAALAGRKGAVGVVNYRTGELLCMVSSPAIDPTEPEPKVLDGVYINRLISAAFVPGSIFKLITAAAAIETLTTIWQRTFFCEGEAEVAGVKIVCPFEHYTQDFPGALANSCNIAFSQIAIMVGQTEMINHVRWSGTTYNDLPYKFEAGTPNFVGSYALHKAIEYINSIAWEAIEAHEQELTAYCEQQLSAMKGVCIYGAGQPKAGVISFNLYNGKDLIHPFDVGTLLDQQGVAVRTGHHCAEPLIDAMGVPGTVRVSFGLYNDKADVDAFITALKKAQSILM